MAGIAADLIRGNTDLIILRFLKDHDSYGYEINKKIRELSEGKYELKEATLYTAFRRLEQDGLIESYWGDENNGARRRYYRITDSGKTMYEQGIQEWEDAQNLIEKLIRSDDQK